ncbi:MAG: HEAT repeat domain-containing protein [Planctomycetota bacterium]
MREIVVDRAFTDEDAELVCAALDSIAAAPDPTDVDTLRPLLLSEEFPTSVVARRLERAFARTIADLSADDQSATLLAAASEAPAASARIARVASFPDVRVDAKTEVFTQLLGTDDVDARAAAAKGLDALGEEGADLALGALEDASEARVQLQLVRILDRRAALVDEEEGEAGAAVKALIGLLKDGVSDPVREAAAVALGREGIHRTAVSALAQAAADGEGEVAITAAIALGRTRADDALGPLRALTERESWMVRASAAEGLKQLSRPECVPPLLALLLDENAAVRATAHRALLRFSDREGQEVEFEEWPGWWQENAKRAKFRTREEERELAEKYGYGVDERTIYRGLDVVVVPGRGDHIELVLERLEIKYRIARGGQLAEAGLHPGAILLVGCTGEITPDDVDIVRWYVHAGGALFTSCWALTYTVEPAFPAVLAKFPSPGEVVDNVFAFPAIGAADSPYLRGVFDGGVRPYYSLLGAHLVEVLDPERAEVLLDSPTAAARHGTGDLAAWFRSGHGVVLDTANHFEEQGFSAASGLRKPIDRQAFAIDHMGLAPTKLRELVDEKWWRSTSKAAEEVLDLSVFRILTNFVREKRIRG